VQLAAGTGGLGSSTNPVSSSPSTDQDPIFDHANGTKTSVTTSATIITPPAACKFLRISTDVDIFVNTAGSAAVDDGTSIRVVANQPEIIPVVAATAVKALSSGGTATVRCTPMKVR
jgi:hypothetical protein